MKVLDAQWLGVPQARQRTIFIGVREDLGKDPVFPKPLALPVQPARSAAVVVRGSTARRGKRRMRPARR
ncbi:MAG: DNA cytosine methyltransferase [Verrucomicrobia bacterium]|nr:DNA cytosine methyltransferase [Verrucomicrobiota bacterium]